LTALLIEQAGFEAAYVSGASVAYTLLGRPDIGLVSASQVADVVFRMRDRVALPLIVDADTGFGNALNVMQTVRSFEKAGATAIQLEDQTSPKRCGHLAGKDLISAAEMVGKVKAAVDARRSDQTLIVARTDAISVEGFEAALARAHAYVDAGADVIFVEAPQDETQMARIGAEVGARVPALANMVEGGKTPLKTADELDALGFRLVITPGAMARAVVWQAQAFLADLKANGSTRGFRDRMLDLSGLNAVIGLNDQVALGQRYESRLKAAE
jgi:2-methylisocitrate lyase-like PEP mutase family enzyme